MNAEHRVLSDLKRKGWAVLEHRWKSIDAEVDAVLIHPRKGLLLLEVKCGSVDRAAQLLNRKQAKRLLRIWSRLSKQIMTSVTLAVVGHDGDIHYYQNPLCDLLSAHDYEKL